MAAGGQERFVTRDRVPGVRAWRREPSVSAWQAHRSSGRPWVHAKRVSAFESGGVLDSCGQATKGAWGMSWRQEASKGVEGCDKPGVAVKRALIPGFPMGTR